MARWALLSADKGVAKAPVAMDIADRLRAAGVAVAGFVQRTHKDGEGMKTYELERLGKGETVVLAVEGIAPKTAAEEAFCSYAFRNEAFETARRWIEEDASGAEVLVLDDISKLEVMGKGHAASLRRALQLDPSKVVLVCARAHQLSYVMEVFGLTEDPVAACELNGDAGIAAEMAENILAACRAT